MVLKRVLDEEDDSKYVDSLWTAWMFINPGGHCQVEKGLKKIGAKTKASILAVLDDLVMKGPKELSPPYFDEAGDTFEDYIMYRIRKGQDRLYMAVQWRRKRVILTSCVKKKSDKTSPKDKNIFRNIVKKVINEEN